VGTIWRTDFLKVLSIACRAGFDGQFPATLERPREWSGIAGIREREFGVGVKNKSVDQSVGQLASKLANATQLTDVEVRFAHTGCPFLHARELNADPFGKLLLSELELFLG
jgi:hypothetical protein